MINKKSVFTTIAFMCFMATAFIVFKIFIENNDLSFANIFIKYIIAIIIGLLFELFLIIVKKYNNKNLKNNFVGFFCLIKFSFTYGILFFGLGGGTFLLLVLLFILEIQISKIEDVLIFFIYLIIAGVFVSLFILTGCIIKLKWRRNQQPY